MADRARGPARHRAWQPVDKAPRMGIRCWRASNNGQLWDSKSGQSGSGRIEGWAGQEGVASGPVVRSRGRFHLRGYRTDGREVAGAPIEDRFVDVAPARTVEPRRAEDAHFVGLDEEREWNVMAEERFKLSSELSRAPARRRCSPGVVLHLLSAVSSRRRQSSSMTETRIPLRAAIDSPTTRLGPDPPTAPGSADGSASSRPLRAPGRRP